MATTAVRLTVPADVPDQLGGDAEGFVREMRIAAAVMWYDRQWLSQGRAAELAGLSRAGFIEACGRYGVSAIQTTADEVSQELAAVEDQGADA